MTKKELLELISDFPDDANVCIEEYSDGSIGEVASVQFYEVADEDNTPYAKGIELEDLDRQLVGKPIIWISSEITK